MGFTTVFLTHGKMFNWVAHLVNRIQLPNGPTAHAVLAFWSIAAKRRIIERMTSLAL